MDVNHLQTWILINVAESRNGYGINLQNIHLQKPDSIELDYKKFVEITDKLIKENLLKPSTYVLNRVTLSKKGQLELTKRLNKLKKEDTTLYVNLVSLSPVFELKERVTTIENFIVNGIFIGLLSYLAYISNQYNYRWVFVGIMVIIIFCSVSFMFNLTSLITFNGRGKRDYWLYNIFSFADKFSGLVFFSIFVIGLTAAMVGIKFLFDLDWSLILTTLILGVIVSTIVKVFTIKDKFVKGLNNLKNKILRKD